MTRRDTLSFKNGFTIIELVIVVIIIGILAAVVLVAYTGIQSAARDKSVLSDLDALDGIETRYGLKNSTAGKAWYSGTGVDSDLSFTQSSGNIIDIVVNSTDYCIRGYNLSSATYKNLATAAKKESTPGICSTLSPSSLAVNDSTGSGGSSNTFTNLTWTQQSAAGSRNWSDIAVSSDNTKLAATVNTGYIYTSSDSGVTWTERTTAGSRAWGEITISDDGTKLAAITGTSLYTSFDSGATWTLRPITSHYSTGGTYSSLSGTSNGTKLIMFIFDDDLCGGDTYLSLDSGVTWTTTNRYGCIAVTAASSDGTRFLGASKYSYIDRTSDGGSSWTQTTPSIGGQYWQYSGSSGASSADLSYLLWMSTSNKLWRSSDNGLTWTEVTALPTAIYTTAVSSSGKVQYAASSSVAGSVWVSTDFGITWSEKTGTGSKTWRAVDASSNGAFVAGIYNGAGYIYTGLFD